MKNCIKKWTTLIILIIVLIILFSRCGDGKYGKKVNDTWDIPYGISIQKVDGCEYVVVKSHDNRFDIIHKENCSNIEHKKIESK